MHFIKKVSRIYGIKYITQTSRGLFFIIKTIIKQNGVQYMSASTCSDVYIYDCGNLYLYLLTINHL